jgi:hypothetical protein
MAFGFVYVLSNSSMPGIYKVGCTERPPHTRAEELSRASGVARRFKVVCYGECEHCARVEGEIHTRLAACRVSGNREFFGGDLSEIVAAVKSHHRLLTFCMVADDGFDPLVIRSTKLESIKKVEPVPCGAPNRALGRAAIARAKELLNGERL